MFYFKPQFLFIIFAMLMIHQSLAAQKKTEVYIPPKAIKMIAPAFIPFILGETGEAQIIVEVVINGEGKVTGTKTVEATFFRDVSVERVAKKWEFEKSRKLKRIAKIKFVFKILPTETLSEDITTIYRDPLEVEVRSRIVVAPITYAPIPIRDQ